MITLELISRKRNPIKRNAFLGILVGFLIMTFIALTGHMIGNAVKVILMLLVAGIFIVSLFIINYSYKFKKIIGSISFSADHIEIDLLERKEIIRLNQLRNIRFRLAGFEGLNKSTIFENIMFPLTRLAYYGGINNFLYLNTGESTRRFEFYIPDKSVWMEIRKVAKQYHDKFNQR